MFKKSLNDLVKGIRSNKKDPEPFIQQSLTEIKNELKNGNLNTKAVAVQKLTYLHMFGHDMEWAAFYFLELMSQPAFYIKRIGYLAASHAITPETDILLMTPQLLRKDLKHPDQYVNGQAMNCLANIVTESLGTELVSEVVALLNSQRPYVRKKAITLLYKIFLQYPDALRPTFPRIQERLKDNHPSVQACAVNVICELAAKNPKNYLPLAPLLYNMLKTLHNNWTLIKIVKLLGTLTPHEKRLAKKLVEPMIEIITNTQAKSLLYECCCTVTKGMQKHMPVVKLAVEKLKEFVVDPDQNLKYLGLLGLNNLMNKYPRIIADLKTEILDCLHDEDITIRYRAVDLLCGVITQKNIKGIMKRLLTAVEESNDYEYKNFLIERIIQASSRDNYANIQSFRWYIRTLIALSEVKGLKHPDLISEQFMNVLIRVKAIRDYGVEKMVDLLTTMEYNEASNNGSILSAAAWLTGEFISEFDDDLMEVLDALISERLSTLPAYIQARFVTAILKVYAEACVRGKPKEVDMLQIDDAAAQQDSAEENGEDEDDERLTLEEYNQLLINMREKIRTGLENYAKSSDVEVQERVAYLLSILKIHEESMSNGTGNLADDIAALFGEELNPVAKGAQGKVPVPEGLDLNSWIGEPFESNMDNINELIDDSWDKPKNADFGLPSDGLTDADFQGVGADTQFQGIGGGPSTYQQQASIFVLPSGPQSPTDVLDPSVSKIIDVRGEQLKIEKKDKKKKKRRRHRRHEAKIEEPPSVITVDEMPEGAVGDEAAATTYKPTDRLSQIDLSKPITAEEVLPTVQSYPLKTEHKPKSLEKPAAEESKERKHKHRKHRHHRSDKNEGDKAHKRKHRKHKHKRHHKRDEESSSNKALPIMEFFEESTTSPKPVNGNGGDSKSKSRLSRRTIASDSNVELTWNAKVKPTAADMITVPVTVTNKGSSTLSALNYSLKESGSVKWHRADPQLNAVPLEGQLAPGAKKEFKMNLKVSDFAQKLDVIATLNYTQNASPDPLEMGDEQDKKNVLEFSFVVPSSLWMEAKIIEAQELGVLIGNSKLQHKASTKISFNDTFSNVDKVAKEVCRNMRFSVVQRVEGKAYNLYSKSLFGNEHVAVQMKASDDDVSIDLKGSNEALLSSLLRELSKLLR
mmetsp:Transcript_886/g.3083  ORF Transcript_886/g.3083 Transcript_886/m.3083 type:complete len:1146 (-) Transcript_886:107-3544(-)